MTPELPFVDLVATVRNAGFDVLDSAGMPLTEQHQAFLEDQNLMQEPARLVLRRPDSERARGIVADVAVGQQLFRIRGDWTGVDDLVHLVEGRPSDRRSNLH